MILMLSSMGACKVLRFALLTVLVGVRAVSAQEPHQHQHDAEEKLGQVNFHVSCKPDAQRKFNRALALLHSLQYVDAESAFAEIRAGEPGCAMAWWGEAMSVYHPLWMPPTPAELRKGQEAVGRARAANARTAR